MQRFINIVRFIAVCSSLQLASFETQAQCSAGTVSFSTGTSSFCAGSSASGTLIVNGYTPTLKRWDKSVYSGGVWGSWTTHSGASGNTISYSASVPTRYRAVVLSDDGCGYLYSNYVEVTQTPGTVAGNISGITSVCAGQTFSLSLGGNVGTVQGFYRRDDAHGWTSIASLNNITITQSSYFKASVKSGNCSVLETPEYYVAVTAPPSVGMLSPSLGDVCPGGSYTLTLSGYTANSISWEKRAAGSSNAWTTVQTSGLSYTESNVQSAWEFRVSATGTCGSAVSNTATVTVVPTPSAGTVSLNSGSTSFCSGESANGEVRVDGYHDGTITRFQKSEYTGGAWGAWVTHAAYAGTNIVAFSCTVPTRYRIELRSDRPDCAGQYLYSNYIETAMLPATVAGALSGVTTICSGQAFSLSLSGYTGTIQGYYSRDANHGWSAIGSLSNITITQPTYFKAVIKNGSCLSKETPEFYVDLLPNATMGILSPTTQSVCTGQPYTLSLSGYSGTTMAWQRRALGSNATWTTIQTSGLSFSESGIQSSWEYRVTATTSCGTVISNVVQVSATTPTAGTVSFYSGQSTFCTGESATGVLQVTGLSGGTLKSWEKSVYSGGAWGGWTTHVANPSGTTVSFSVTSPTRFRATLLPDCSGPVIASGYVEVMETTPTTAGTVSGPTDVCANANFALTLSGNVGSVQGWYFQDDQHLNWATLSNPSAVSINRPTSFKAVVKNGGCLSKETNIKSVTIYAAPAVGQLTSSTGTICPDGSYNLTLSSASATTIKWQQRPADTDLDWTTSSQGSTLNYAVNNASSSADWRAVAVNTCGVETASAPLTVRVKTSPTPPLNATDTWFANDNSSTLRLTVAITDRTYTVKWYDSPTNTGIPLNTGESFYLSPPFSIYDYYARTVDANGCISQPTKITIPQLAINPTAVVKSELLRVGGVTQEADIALKNAAEKNTSLSYLDGLGRTMQIVAQKASPMGSDMVQPVEYDVYGRSSKRYLPYVASTSDGSYHGSFKSEQANFYNASGDKIANDAAPYALIEVEDSPLGRLAEQGNVGALRQPGTGHTVNLSYSFNTGATNNELEEVRKFNADGTSTGFYGANTLTRVETINEEGNKQVTFINSQGLLIAKKQQLDEVINGVAVNYLQTYYLYDDFGRIKYIIPPKGVTVLKAAAWSFSATFRDNVTYQFNYDTKGRLIEKRVPGQAWNYYCYDNLNRLVLMQDGILKGSNSWMFIKYDKKGRTVMKGIYQNSSQTSRPTVQSVLDTLYQSSNNVFKDNSWYERRGAILHGYTNNSFPKTNSSGTALQILTVNYFDDYDFDYNGANDFEYTPQGLPQESQPVASTLGLPTGSKRIVFGTTTWLYTYVFYDEYFRPIQVRSSNHLNAAIDNLNTMVLDFEGKVIANKKLVRVGTGKETEITHRYEYDPAGRVRKIFGPSANMEPVQWGSFVSTAADGGGVYKTTATNSWDAGAFSTNGLAANENGWIEFKGGETTSAKMIGFSDVNVDANYNTIDYALYLMNNGTIAIYENGSARAFLGAYTIDDVFSVERKQGTIYYKKNNFIIYTSATSSTGAVFADCAFNTPGARFNNIKLFRPSEVEVAKYEYNELGQMVDKKLFSNDNGATYKQSVDYRYNINGQLASINNAKLTNDGTANDDTNDFFGIEYLYDATETGLANTPFYDGKISAIKWKAAGKDAGTADQRSYKYSYDKTGKLDTTIFQAHNGTGWLKDVGVNNEGFSYDHNGNILSLQRNMNQRGLQMVGGVPTVTSNALQIDNLTYTYNSTINDRLMKVEDGAVASGFDNGTTGTADDYTYDAASGYASKDLNKGISAISYNALGKVAQVTFSDGRKIIYTYDGLGNKIITKNYEGTTLKNTTDYVSDAVYENGAFSFIGSPEGRIVMQGTKFEYQYAISDHQGNTRVVFTSEAPAPLSITATFEGNASDNVDQFQNVDVNAVWSFPTANHTPSGAGVIRLNQNYKTGPAKSLKVFPGDMVDVEAWTYFEGSAGFGTTSSAANVLITAVTAAFGGSTVPGDPGYAVYSGVDEAYGAFGTAANLGDGRPSAYLNYILFDQNYNVLDMGWKPVPDEARGAKQRIAFDGIRIQEAGFLYTYLSYEGESNQYVYFDDYKVTHTRTPVLQYTDYYAFGLQTSDSWTRDNVRDNTFLYNGGAEMNKSTGLYETFFRGYDPALGRFLQVDPLAVVSASWSTYQYGKNNPIYFNDPMGDSERPSQSERDAAGEMYDLGLVMGHDLTASRGSGYYWADGMYQSDWSASGGSEIYRQGIAAGLTDIGGKLYLRGPNGYQEATEEDGKLYVPVTTTVYKEYGDGVTQHLATYRRRVTIAEAQRMGLLDDPKQNNIKVFATGNYDRNFKLAMEYMNGQSGITYGFVLENGKIAVLPHSGFEYKGNRRTNQFVDGQYVRNIFVVPNKLTKNGFYLNIDGKWERATSMLVSGFTAKWGQYYWNEDRERAYYNEDNSYRGIALRCNVNWLYYLNNPRGWDHSVYPPQQTKDYEQIKIK